jgi:hypothetical protein
MAAGIPEHFFTDSHRELVTVPAENWHETNKGERTEAAARIFL